MTPDDVEPLRSLGFKVNPDGSVPPIYLSPLTAAMVAEMEASPRFHKVMKQEPAPEQMLTLFPERYRRGGHAPNTAATAACGFPAKARR